MPQSLSYVYDGSKEIERERLSLLERGTKRLRALALDTAVPSAVHNILDVGCGAGAVGFDLARRFPGASLVGTDINMDILREAKRAAAGQIQPMLAQGNALDLPFQNGCFDLVACQYLLQHLADPVSALAEMRRVAREEAMLAVFEWDDGVNFSYPPVPSQLDRLFAAKVQLIRLRGGDRYIGRKLHHLISSAGWSSVDINLIPDVWQGPADRQPQLRGTELSMRELKPQLLGLGLIDDEEFEAAIRQLYEYYCGDVFSVVFYFAAFARKPPLPA